MYELIKLTEHDYYIECPARVGLVKIGGNDVVLIDGGSDPHTAKKIFRIIEENGFSLKAIYNTHSHADHVGGNRFLQEKTGCRIYAKGLECVYTNSPILEPIGLWGGRPGRMFQNHFLMAETSVAEPLSPEKLPDGMQIIDLPGHALDMVGFLTADGTAFVGDSVSSAETIAKYGICYLWNTEDFLASLNKLTELKAKIFLPAHVQPTEDIAELVRVNAEAVEAVKEKILAHAKEPITFEKLLKALFDDYSLTLTAQQYVLVGSTLRSYLTGLYETGRITCLFAENEMLWQAT